MAAPAGMPASGASRMGIIRQTRSTSYTSIKLTGAAVRTETLRLREKYQDIIIDTGGRDTISQRAALTVAGRRRRHA